ncbi:MAG: glycoside hydrolase, partial [Actinobacteria bacterium]|nr:glycoside hydrolase [Actinomycetota bacterium]
MAKDAREDRPRTARALGILAAVALLGAAAAGPARAETVGNFSAGQLSAGVVGASGCGTNGAGEPAIHVTRADNVFLGSENGIGNGSGVWRGLGAVGGAGASACTLEYRGQPNVLLDGLGLAGGDIDVAVASAPNPAGAYNLYVASLNLASVNVARSRDNGTTFASTPLVLGIPLDDREWIAAFGADTALVSYHDILTNDINVLRSDNDGALFTQISQAIPLSDYRARNNQIGNLVIDHANLPPTGGFYAYQAFVAPSTAAGGANNEAFLAVSSDGGHTWADRSIPCSVSTQGLDHNFPNVSVDPAGRLWYAWSDNQDVYTATSTDRGLTWT